MRFRTLLCVISLLLGAQSLQARIGETQEECIARYGAIVEKRKPRLPESDPEALLFSKGGVTVWIEYQKGKAWRIVFRKVDLNATEVEALLRANMPLGGWGAALQVSGRMCRRSFDTEFLAILTPPPDPRGSVFLEIVSRAYTDAHYSAYLVNAERAKDAKPASGTPASLDGF